MKSSVFDLRRLALLLGFPLPLQAGSRQERYTLKLKSGGVLHVTTYNSQIQVSGWDREEVSLVADIHDSAKNPIHLNIQPGNGERIEIEAIFPENSWIGITFAWGLACNLTLQVPKKLVATIQTRNGRIELTDLAGAVEAKTSNSQVIVRNLEGDLRGSTSNGALELDGVSGALDFSTSNGGIEATRLGGEGKGIRLRTSNGRLNMDLGKVTGELHARTSGHNKVKIERQGMELVDMRRYNHVHLRLSGGTQTIDLSTSNGDITLR